MEKIQLKNQISMNVEDLNHLLMDFEVYNHSTYFTPFISEENNDKNGLTIRLNKKVKLDDEFYIHPILLKKIIKQYENCDIKALEEEIAEMERIRFNEDFYIKED